MPRAESASPPAPAAHDGLHFKIAPVVLIAWSAIAASAILGGPATLAQMSTDDYMRLVQVRDLLAGQGWYDLTQYRLDPPAGMVAHWTRIVDAPLALLIRSLTPLVGRPNAEWTAMTLWPLFLYLPTLALVGMLARRLADATAALPAIVLTAVSAAVLVHFRPGALDHHGAQLLLLLATLYGATARADARLIPALGGLAAALSIGIGLEMVPALAAILAAVGLRWAIDGEKAAPSTACFGLAFGFGSIAVFAVTVAPANWLRSSYDQISIVSVVAATLAGGAIALLAAASRRLPTMRLRLGLGLFAGLASAGLVLGVFPDALSDPFGDIDPLLVRLWLSHIMEIRGALEMLKSPAEAVPIYVPPLAALAIAAYALARSTPAERALYMPPLFALVALIAVSIWGVRSLAAANLIAQPILAAALLRLIGSHAEAWRARYIGALALLSSPVLLLAGESLAASTAGAASNRSVLSCYHAADVAELKRLPAGLVLTFIDAGPAILATTPHSVLGAPYHRNKRGNFVAYSTFQSAEPAAARMLRERGVDYVAVCLESSDAVIFGREASQGLAARLVRGEVPPYLEPIPADPADRFRIFSVR